MDRVSGGRNLLRRGWRLRVSEPFWANLRTEGIDDLEALTGREFGDVVTDARSSWVRTSRIGPKNVYVKTYDYSSTVDRRRGWGRTTWLARSRARREYEALAWFAANGFFAAQGLLLAELRSRLGVLHRAVLVTESWGEGSIERLLPDQNTADRMTLLAAVSRAVDGWHQAGWRDQNLDPRNLLARRSPVGNDGWQIAKIDSPRYALRRAGHGSDAASRADWSRLRNGLEKIGVTPDELDGFQPIKSH